MSAFYAPLALVAAVLALSAERPICAFLLAFLCLAHVCASRVEAGRRGRRTVARLSRRAWAHATFPDNAAREVSR